MKLLIAPLLVFYRLFVLTHGRCSRDMRDLPEEDEELIVKVHNNYRLELAHGKVDKQPKAVNMWRMYWDQELADEARNLAYNCINDLEDPYHSTYKVLSLNYAWSPPPLKQGGVSKNWTEAIESWWNEHFKYTYPNNSDKNTRQYTQVAWANTFLIGCAYKEYKMEDVPVIYYYVCAYAPAGNRAGQAPYQTGTTGCEDLCEPPIEIDEKTKYHGFRD